ncbi:MAG: methyltransferase domain-containing protein, partial [Atribacterota bacterium]
MREYKKKWEKYNIGNIKWIDSNREHFCRKHFIDYVISDSTIRSILEIGGGELIEAQKIIDLRKDISYSVVDVSSVFLSYCDKIDGIDGYCGDMVNLPFKNKYFDLVYGSSILEHSPDIKKTLKGFT